MEVAYEIVYYKKALKDLEYWKSSGNIKAQDKITEIIIALEANPYSDAPGDPEKLKYTTGYSRRINSKDRVTYDIYEDKKEVVIFSM
jgi:toxin YoeB